MDPDHTTGSSDVAGPPSMLDLSGVLMVTVDETWGSGDWSWFSSGTPPPPNSSTEPGVMEGSPELTPSPDDVIETSAPSHWWSVSISVSAGGSEALRASCNKMFEFH